MNITGKLICGIIGLLIGNLPGLLIGIWIGHSFDKRLDNNLHQLFGRHDPAKAQGVFFNATFEMLGHIAKADGVVTQNEIAAAEQIMAKLGIAGERRQQAIDAFNRGKSQAFDFEQCIQELQINCLRSPSLIQMFIEIQIVAATADGAVAHPEMQILYKIGKAFRIAPNRIEQLVEMVIAQQSFNRGRHSGSNANRGGPSINEAYKVLGISADANKQEIKRAYRKLISQHHPDKLVSKGMPEEMIEVATEKSQEIQAAYDMIKKHKGI